MAREIVWTKRAQISYRRIIFYLEAEWGQKVIKNFLKKSVIALEIINANPEIGTIECYELGVHGFLITKHNRLFY